MPNEQFFQYIMARTSYIEDTKGVIRNHKLWTDNIMVNDLQITTQETKD